MGLASLPYQIYFAPGWEVAQSTSELEMISRDERTAWLVYSFPDHLARKYEGVMEVIHGDFVEMRRFPGTLGDGDIHVWRSDSGPDLGAQRE